MRRWCSLARGRRCSRPASAHARPPRRAVRLSRRARPRVRCARRAVRRQRRRSQHLSGRYATGAVKRFVGAPEGMADDLVFLADGTVVWTSIRRAWCARAAATGRSASSPNLVSVNSDQCTQGRPAVCGAGVRRRRVVGARSGRGEAAAADPQGSRRVQRLRHRARRQAVRSAVVQAAGRAHRSGQRRARRRCRRLRHAGGGELRFEVEPLRARHGARRSSCASISAAARSRVVAKLATALDNLAIDSRDRVFVSNMADNGIQEVDVSNGTARQVVKGALAMPLGIAAVADGSAATRSMSRTCSRCARSMRDGPR